VACGDTAGAEALKQISPVAWQHVNFHGRYEFTKRPQPIDLPDIVRHLAQRPIVLGPLQRFVQKWAIWLVTSSVALPAHFLAG